MAPRTSWCTSPATSRTPARGTLALPVRGELGLAFAPGQVLRVSIIYKATAAPAVKRVMGRHSGPPFTPPSAWDAFDAETRAGIARAGGLRAIWESTNETGLTRAFTDGYRNGTHAH